MSRSKKDKMTERELEELLDYVRFYLPYGIFRTPVKVLKRR